jgi:single-stranded DNA-binding protein
VCSGGLGPLPHQPPGFISPSHAGKGITMSDTNLVILNGRLCADAEFTHRERFVAVRLRIATSYSYLNDQQERVEKSEFHTVRVNITEAQVPAWRDRCLKGRRMQVQGMLITDEVKRDGQESKFYTFIRARSVDVTLPEVLARHSDAPSESVSSPKPPLQAPPVAPSGLRGREDTLTFN